MIAIAPIKSFIETDSQEPEGESPEPELKSQVSHLIQAEYAARMSAGMGRPLDEMLLGSVGDGRLRVRVPIVVRFETENDDFVAEAVDFEEFGFGKNPGEALTDLQRALAELYFTLQKEQERLGADLQRIWTKLQENISPSR